MGRHESIHFARRTFVSICRRLLLSARLLPPPIDRSEFAAVNRVAGREALAEELSGLELLGRVEHVQFEPPDNLQYRYRPSASHSESKRAIDDANRSLHSCPVPQIAPPILLFTQEDQVSPQRYQALISGGRSGENDIRDLKKVERSFRPRSAWLIGLPLPEIAQHELAEDRQLLTFRQREFLRQSPIPRIVVAGLMVIVLSLGTAWFLKAQSAEANALASSRTAESELHLELTAAHSFGIRPDHLAAIVRRVDAFDTTLPAGGLLPSAAQATAYENRAAEFRSFAIKVRRLLAMGRKYWARQEGLAYAGLVDILQQASGSGFSAALPELGACDSVTCFRTTIGSYKQRTAHWQQTLRTVDSYGQQVLLDGTADVALGNETQAVKNLLTSVRVRVLPARMRTPNAGSSSDSLGLAAALAHFDRVWLENRIAQSVRGELVMVSSEAQELSCYQAGKLVFQSPVVAVVPPIGRFTVALKEAGIPVRYWHTSGNHYRYVWGSVPDRLVFSGDEALQGAPWRDVFGPDGLTVAPYYAPTTTGSIDLPVQAARFVFDWAAVGTPIVSY